MKKYIVVPLMIVFLTAGCELSLSSQKTEDINRSMAALAAAMEKGEPVVKALEEATGKSLPENVSGTGEVVSEKASGIAKAGGAIATLFGHPEVGVALTGLSALLATMAGFFRNRKNAVVKTLVAAVENVPGGGKAVEAAAPKYGTSQEIEAAYLAMKKLLG